MNKTNILARACRALLAGRIEEGRKLYQLAQEIEAARFL